MDPKPVGDRARELLARHASREETLLTLYLERYPLTAVTAALRISSRELKELAKRLSLALSRCPQGHELMDAPGLHASSAHYCPKCERWFTDGMLGDEINLEIARLKERERSPTGPPDP